MNPTQPVHQEWDPPRETRNMLWRWDHEAHQAAEDLQHIVRCLDHPNSTSSEQTMLSNVHWVQGQLLQQHQYLHQIMEMVKPLPRNDQSP